MNWQLLLMALGLALIIEGLPYFLHPEGAFLVLRRLERLDIVLIRVLGFTSLVIGVLTLLWGHSLGS